MKIGILGGTFDPIHNAHIEILKTAAERCDFDKIYVMPTPHPPHKDDQKITCNFHRVNMIKLAIKDLKNVEYSDFEINMNTTTYTADTLKMLKELKPEDDFNFIFGSDSIASFLSWYHPEYIIKNAGIYAVKRKDNSGLIFDNKVKEIEEEFHKKINIIEMPPLNISSSFIRTNSYKDIENAVPVDVFKYIVDNNLYKNNDVNAAWSINDILVDLESKLKKNRYIHTVSVANTAKKMAEVFNVNPNIAYLAGILHDCAKYLSDKELLDIATINNIPISKYERIHPFLLHGKVGAHFAKTLYKITNEDVLNAVTYHTTGRENMSTLEKIIFSADYIEPGRDKQKNLEYLRQISLKDLDLLTVNILKDTIEYRKSLNDTSIDENTIKAFNFYRDKLEAQ